jgi:hypothetical protein
VLERAETLNIPCALVIGRPSPGIAMIDIMTNNSISRPGDLITADSENCFIFLNACPQAVLLPALERVLGLAVDTAFVNVRFVIERAEIQSELAALLRTAEHENLPDYSSLAGLPVETANIEESPSSSVVVAAPSSLQENIKAPDFSKLISNIGANAATAPNKKLEIRNGVKQISKLANRPIVTEVHLDANADTANFEYDDTTNVRPLGRKEVPRATRSIQSNH